MRKSFQFRIYPNKKQLLRELSQHAYTSIMMLLHNESGKQSLTDLNNHSVRIHRCPSCGLVMDRDQVSAILIKNRSSTAGIAGIQAQLSNLNREAMTWEAPSESKR